MTKFFTVGFLQYNWKLAFKYIKTLFYIYWNKHGFTFIRFRFEVILSFFFEMFIKLIPT